MTPGSAARVFGAALGRCFRAPRRTQLHAGPPRLGQPDRNRLLGRTRSVLAFADVMHLFANEFARLRARRLSLPLVAPCAPQRALLRHLSSLFRLPPEGGSYREMMGVPPPFL